MFVLCSLCIKRGEKTARLKEDMHRVFRVRPTLGTEWQVVNERAEKEVRGAFT
jgi:hypothetical protein